MWVGLCEEVRRYNKRCIVVNQFELESGQFLCECIWEQLMAIACLRGALFAS
jgi:hypothetical protein